MPIEVFVKQPVEIEALQWTGDNGAEVQSFLGGVTHGFGFVKGDYVDIGTREGLMVASKGDWIIKGVKGEFYPCKPDIFDITYRKRPYPSEPAMRAAVELEIQAALGAVKTVTIGAMIQRAIDAAQVGNSSAEAER
jgi:hypothetical protein